MAHLVTVDDERGDVVDAYYYCSDWCAQQSPHYAGWYGCVELEHAQSCDECGAEMGGYCDGPSGGVERLCGGFHCAAL